MIYPSSIEKLIESFKELPGIGDKTAERLAFSIMDLEDEKVAQFSVSLMDVKKKIKKCKICNHLTESETCNICNDKKRNKNIVYR